MILLDCIYINNSGGKVLLDLLVKRLLASKADVYFLFDKRVEPHYNHIPLERRTYLNSGLLERERFYKNHRSRWSFIFCFNNIPPMIKPKAKVVVYFHNVLILNGLFEKNMNSFLDRCKLFLIKCYLYLFVGNVDEFIVQTHCTKNLIVKELRYNKENIYCMPFFETQVTNKVKKAGAENNFLFVSDGNAHKNHLRLIKAWEVVQRENPLLVLNLTISETYPNLLQEIKVYQNKGLNIVNHGRVKKESITDLYAKAKFIVYPSLYESFGLGLVEGLNSNCIIIAADRPYARELVGGGDLFFDPESTKEISKAILRAFEDYRSKESTHELSITNNLNEIIKKYFI